MALPVVDDGDVGIVFCYVGDFHGIEGHAEELEVGREVPGKGQSRVVFLGVIAVIFLAVIFLGVFFECIRRNSSIVVIGSAEGWVNELVVDWRPRRAG